MKAYSNFETSIEEQIVAEVISTTVRLSPEQYLRLSKTNPHSILDVEFVLPKPGLNVPKAFEFGYFKVRKV